MAAGMKARAAAALMRIRPGGLDILALPAFRNLLAAGVMFDFSGNLRLAAQSWVVLDLTGSALWVGLSAGARGVPAIVFGLFGGVAADRFPRKAVLAAGWTVLAILAVATGLLIVTGEVEAWHIVAFSAATGTVIAFTLPASLSLVASLVPGTRISNALGLTSLSWSSMEMAGPAIAGAMLAWATADVVFWVVAGGYAAAVIIIMRVREPERERAVEKRSVFADLREGVSFVRRAQPLAVLTVLAFLQNLFAVAIMPLVPVYARDVLHAGAAGYGLLAGAMGAGFLCGALTISAFGNFRRKGLTMLLSGLVWDSGAAAFGFSRSMPLSMTLLFIVGFSGPFWHNAAVSVFQSRAGDQMRGRVMSVWGIASEAFPIGWMVGGALAVTFGNEQALIISALCGTPVALLFFLLSPSFRKV